jgi:hypothetical protein
MNIMKNLILCSAVFLLLLAACGPTLKVTSDVNKQANFTGYKTFALYNPAGQRSPISELNRNRIDQGVIAAMTAKGYTQADTTTADLLVNPITIAKQGQNVTANTDYYGYGGFYRPYYWGGGMGMASSNTTFSVDKYIDGSVIIDVIDRQKRELLWQGIGNSQIDGPIKDPDTKIPAAMAKIMASFPAKM